MKNEIVRRGLIGLAFLGFALLTILPADVAFAGDEEDARSFVQSVAATVYGLAWPTATYESFSLKSVDRVRGGYDARVRLNGISAFSDSALWMEIVFEVRNGALNDVRVARHNAILSAPFATAEAMGQLVADLLEESSSGSPAPSYYASGSGSSNNRQGFRLHVANQLQASDSGRCQLSANGRELADRRLVEFQRRQLELPGFQQRRAVTYQEQHHVLLRGSSERRFLLERRQAPVQRQRAESDDDPTGGHPRRYGARVLLPGPVDRSGLLSSSDYGDLKTNRERVSFAMSRRGHSKLSERREVDKVVGGHDQ